ncbi:peptidase domain-containing ABC transporter [Caballeronia sp. TF1N1]|uniref:peptidase domain-containing ABC transporter n=1 Tax=Caballeronia sp. TF1N1 TaxID=2878153 RepID=UPI001FD005D5|nr:peptidase domain-containing ABC transporter [Caballeronia sp. TF1N1]
MDLSNVLNLGFARRLRPILQTEAAECGLACIGIVANYFGHATTLSSLRSRFPQSLKGSTIGQLISISDELKLGSRPLKLDIDEASQLRLPAIIHWNFDHFVVLKSVTPRGFTILDPAVGQRRISRDEFSQRFTGVALELWPSPLFEKREKAESISIRSLWGSVVGLRRSLAQIFVMAACLEIMALLLPLLTQVVIDDVLVASDADLLTVLVIGYIILTLIQQLIVVARYWAVMYFGTSLSVQWKANVFARLIRLPAEFFERRHAGDIVSRFGTVDAIQSTVTLSLVTGIIDGCVALVTCALMLLYSAKLSAIPIGFMLVYALGRFLRYRPLRDSTMEESIHSARSASHFLESVRGSKTIKLFVRQASRTNIWLSLLVNQVNASLRIQKLGIAYHSANSLLSAIENIMVIWVGAKLVLDHTFSVGLLVAYISYKNQFDAKVTSVIDRFFEFRLLHVQMERLSDIVHTPAETTVGSGPYSSHELNEYSVELSDISFQYSPSDPYVLRGVSASIRSGESVAIVGPSGCGKSTLANILLGLYSPTSGSVSIGGVAVSDIGLDETRNMIGAVLQDDSLFAGTIEENITFFDPTPDRAWMKECAAMARMDHEIVAMPMGYRSLIGDLGSGLSGGQKQRIMLARAFYKKPKILLLDEATSHLDTLNEKLINENIRRMQITRIFIAHRKETIDSADRILDLSRVARGPRMGDDLTTAPVRDYIA